MTSPKKLAIIDGKSVFYRGYYAMPNLSLADGTPTGGVFGFASMALEVLKQLKPDYVCVAWDKPKTNIRRRLELYPEYKANRKPAPPDFYAQIPLLHELLEAFGWPLYEFDDYEADDIMGTLAVQATEQGIETQLVTSDLDMLQLINPLVHVYALKKGLSNIELFRPETFTLKYGISPEQFLDLKALKGDSSDNIPGVPGIGEKGATALLQEHETLDGVYENLALLKDSVRKKLEAGRESAYLSKKIAAIWTDAPVTLDLEQLDVANCKPDEVAEKLQKLEFKSLVRQLPEVMQVADTVGFGDASTLTIPERIVLDTKDSVTSCTLPEPEGYIIVQSTNKLPHGKEPTTLSLSPTPDSVITFDFKAGVKDVRNKLEPYLRKAPLVGHDIKATLQLLRHIGITDVRVDHDVFIGAFLINSLRREQSLSDLAANDLGIHLEPDTVTIAETTAVIRSLYEKQQAELTKLPKVAALAQDIEWPIIKVLANMEYEGIALDTTYLDDMSVELEAQISEAEQEIYKHAGKEFNVASPAQLSEILFETLQLPTQGIKKGKTAYSTAANELDKLRGAHPIINLITQFREYTKLKNTYVDTLPKMVDNQSRLHTTFNLTIAQTGRLSSTDPNLQNIPVRTDLGKRIRTAFVAGPGQVLVSADYSQFELRLAAYLADDKQLIDMFNRDIDVHTATAAQVYGREPEDITKNMRRDAKVINFGILYGMSPHGLSIATGMTITAAKDFIDKYFELRKPILTYMDGLKDKARKDGYVETLFGRRRPTPDIHSKNFVVRSSAERAAINMPIQGTEADLMKMAMVAVDAVLPDGAKQLLQIHDSILVECSESDGELVAKLLKDTMEGIHKLPVKLTVDTSIGTNWGEL